MNLQGNRSKQFQYPRPIRNNREELNVAITELEKRGYILDKVVEYNAYKYMALFKGKIS